MIRDDTASGDTLASPNPREKVLECASRLLDEGGPDAVTIRKVAALSGITPPAIYELFGDKARLIDALVLHSIERVLQQLGKLEGSEDVRDYMRRGFRQLVAFGRAHPWHFQLAERLPLRMILGEAAREKLNAPLASWAGADPSAAEEIRLIRQVFWVVLHGLITLPLARPDEVWQEDLADVCFEAMSTGILAIRSASKR
jgi:AcrR family transcriptional regulator